MIDQIFFQRHIVFDDAVMHYGEAAGIAYLRMGINIRRLSVSSPSGMTDANGSFDLCAAFNHIA